MATITKYMKDIRNLLDESPIMERKSFIKSFVKEARVKDDEVSLICTMPIAPQKITGEKLAVLPIVHYGGR